MHTEMFTLMIENSEHFGNEKINNITSPYIIITLDYNNTFV